MLLAPWRPTIARALHRNRSLPYARYFQLATVHPDGRPANRTLVFRGFRDETNQIQMVTDDRSQKPEQIAHNPWAEVCWYFPNTREQFRLTGTLQLIRATESDEGLQKARHSAWQALSDSARVQFAWAQPREPKAPPETFSPPPPSEIDPLPQFCLLLLEPVGVDHLELRGEPQNRRIYTLDDDKEWIAQDVNP
jgi:pyridoxamine 5'-phosphate oxidase